MYIVYYTFAKQSPELFGLWYAVGVLEIILCNRKYDTRFAELERRGREIYAGV